MKVKRFIFRAGLILVALVVVAAVVAWVMIDRIARTGIEEGGKYALGVPTTVQDVNLSLLGGTCTIDALQVDNPTGYKSPFLLKTGKFDLKIKPGSVMSDTIEVTSFALDDLEMNIHQAAGKSNVTVVLDHVKSLGCEAPKDKPADKPAEKQPSGKKVKVDKIVISNVVANVYLPVTGSAGPLTVKVPKLELDKFSSEEGVTVSQVMGQLLPAIVAAVVESGKGVIPADFAKSLNADVAGTAQALGGKASALVGQAGGQAGKAVQEGADKALKGTKDGLEGLKGLIPGAKPPEPKK